MTNTVTVLCEMDDCIYHLHDPKEGEAYQNRCGNDEIEIAEFSKATNLPECYTYEKQPEILAVRKGTAAEKRADKRKNEGGSTMRGSRSTA